MADHPTASDLFLRAIERIARAAQEPRRQAIGEPSIQAIEAVRQKQEDVVEDVLLGDFLVAVMEVTSFLLRCGAAHQPKGWR